MIVKVKEPQKSEIALIRKGQIVFTYFHLAADRELTEGLLRTGSTCVAYETLADGPLYKLFNIREDAACTRDDLAQNTEVAARLRVMLEGWMAADPTRAPAASAQQSEYDLAPRSPIAKGAST